MKSDIVKLAFFRSFYDELDRIAEAQEVQKLAGAFFAKHARALTSKTRKKLSPGVFVFPEERRYPIHDESHARNALARASGKSEEARVRAAVHARYPNIGKEKKAVVWGWAKSVGKTVAGDAATEARQTTRRLIRHSTTGAATYAGVRAASKAEKKPDIEKKAMGMPDIPSWVAPVATHAAAGALPGALVGAASAKKGKRTRGALKGAAVGAAIGAGGGHVVNRVKRNVDVANRASKKIGFDMADFSSQDAKTREKFLRLSHIYRQNTPIYKTAAHEDWEKEEKKDSFLKKHKGKIIGGLALATAAGVGGKLLHTKLKGKTPVNPSPAPTAAARHAAAPPPPRTAPKARPAKEQGSTHRGTTVDIPGMKKGKGQRTTLADLKKAAREKEIQDQVDSNARKAAGRTKHKDDHKKPPAGYPPDYDDDGDHEFRG
jgi:hypothetical protein